MRVALLPCTCGNRWPPPSHTRVPRGGEYSRDQPSLAPTDRPLNSQRSARLYSEQVPDKRIPVTSQGIRGTRAFVNKGVWDAFMQEARNAAFVEIHERANTPLKRSSLLLMCDRAW